MHWRAHCLSAQQLASLAMACQGSSADAAIPELSAIGPAGALSACCVSLRVKAELSSKRVPVFAGVCSVLWTGLVYFNLPSDLDGCMHTCELLPFTLPSPLHAPSICVICGFCASCIPVTTEFGFSTSLLVHLRVATFQIRCLATNAANGQYAHSRGCI
jgi:hypothetical protein